MITAGGSRPKADDEMTIESCKTIRCRIGTRPLEVDIDTETLDVISGQKLTMDRIQPKLLGCRSRTLTTRRGGWERSRCDVIEQTQRQGRMRAECLEESGQATGTCNSSCNQAVNLKQMSRPSVDVPKRTLTCVKLRLRSVCATALLHTLYLVFTLC